MRDRAPDDPIVHVPSESGSRGRSGATPWAVALAAVALGVGAGLDAARAQDEPGGFDVLEAGTEQRSGVYYLNALFDFSLSADAREALRSGLPIVIRIEIEVIRPRRFWLDSEQSLTQRYRLEYHALTERYLVVNLNSGDEISFSGLEPALGFIGRVDDLPVIDATLLEPGQRYDIRVRAVLDTDQLPGPLRLLAFWRRDWSIASDWHRWRLQEG